MAALGIRTCSLASGNQISYHLSSIIYHLSSIINFLSSTITPEAAVFASGRMLYRGRIDDHYVALGQARPAPTTHDLQDALEAALNGRPVPNPTTKAVGCIIADLK